MPTVKSNVEPTSAEYALAYKTMFILHQGLNPKVPVLVRTDWASLTLYNIFRVTIVTTKYVRLIETYLSFVKVEFY